jgi:transposase
MVDDFRAASCVTKSVDWPLSHCDFRRAGVRHVRNAVLNVIGVVRIAMLTGREALITNGDAKDARIHQLESEVAMLREELRINGARMKRVPSHRRPQYTAIERMAILQLRAMRGWNKAETARHFFVTDDTIRSWLRRVDDDSLVQTQTPVNRFPDFVRYAVQQIKLFCPTLGKVKIADMLARAGIHIGKTTVGRILKEKPVTMPRIQSTTILASSAASSRSIPGTLGTLI